MPISLTLILWLGLGHAAAPASGLNDDVPPDWITVHAEAVFSVMAPPGTRFVRASGIDSFVGSFVGPGFELSFDYGWYSSPLAEHVSDEGYEVEEILIQGREARVITSYAPGISSEAPHFIGIHFPGVKESAPGTTKLTIYGSVASKDDYGVVKTMFSSIRFGSQDAKKKT